jgi:predicted helicase
MGIDLVAETKDREYWAIQVKYRTDAKKRLSFRDLATFTALTYTTCHNFDYALVCTTTDRVTHLLEGLPGKVGFRTSEVWLELPPAFFRQARARLAKKTPRIEPLKPRPHQRQAIANAREHYQKRRRKRGKLIHPCAPARR